jgi:pyruvate/2-oxoglutarate dehydrogenase complex dihydrolipoamide dehydrogenase (E3) component
LSERYDLAIIGAGSGGLTAAGFAAKLGAKVVLIEKHRIGGDCTWTGCVPSKALLKAAKVAHEVRTAVHYGIHVGTPVIDMARVRAYVQRAIEQVYQFERPEDLTAQGIDVIQGTARFLDPHTVEVNGKPITAKSFLITTGAHPAIPPVTGLCDVPYLTYERIFDNDLLPIRMAIIGGGPIGMELAQAYQRLGSRVTLIAETLLPKEEPEVRDVMHRVFSREGIRITGQRATSARKDGTEVVVATGSEEIRCDLLLVAAGRKPSVASLHLDAAGVVYSERGIPVDSQLRTSVKHIYAAGDVTGGYQFTHFAGWQAFQATRNALLPGSSPGLTDLVPWVTFTDPEVAHIGLTEAQAREKHGDAVEVRRWDMSHTDRAVCENDKDGFLKLVMKKDGTIVGATMVAARAGEAITELILAIKNEWKASDLASTIHPYPTYSTVVQQLAAELATESALSGTTGRLATALSKLLR